VRYLIDSNKIIDFFKGKEQVVHQLARLFDEGVAISVISVAELIRGAYLSQKPQKNITDLENFILVNKISVLDVTKEIAEIYGEKQGELERKGKKVPGFDMLIAATCLQHGLKVVSSDRHFARVQGLEVLA